MKSFLMSTLIGGVVFVIPFIIIVALEGQVKTVVLAVLACL